VQNLERVSSSRARVVIVYVLGVATGVQAALYLWDTWDDGVSDPLSGVIAVGFLLASSSFIAYSFARSRAA
jgi:hypothetical protein